METHPTWLKKSAVPLTIVCGPPCGGKTTYVRERAVKDDLVIDLDTIRRKIQPTYRHWSSLATDDKLMFRSLRVRNMMLAGLAKRTTGCAWFIVAAPAAGEREWWVRRLGGTVVLLNPGQEECRRRAWARHTPLAVEGIDRWFARSEDQHWSPPTYRVSIGPDGWPEEDEDDADEVREFLRF